MISSLACVSTIAPIRIERPECEPPPTFSFPVSPNWTSMVSYGASRRSAITCAKVVSCPWPDAWVPMTTSMRPCGSTSTSVRSAGVPVDRSI